MFTAYNGTRFSLHGVGRLAEQSVRSVAETMPFVILQAAPPANISNDESYVAAVVASHEDPLNLHEAIEVAKAYRSSGILTFLWVLVPHPSDVTAYLQDNPALVADTTFLVDLSALGAELPPAAEMDHDAKAVLAIRQALEAFVSLCCKVSFIDPTDIRMMFQDKGLGFIGIGEATGVDHAQMAATRAIASLRAQQMDIANASAAVACITGFQEVLDELDQVSQVICKAMADDTNYLAGMAVTPEQDEYTRVTIFALTRENG